MAASLRLLRNLSRVIRKDNFQSFTNFSKRYLLNKAYACEETWKKQLNDSIFKDVQFSEFAFQVRDQLERTGRASAVDINIMSHLLNQMDEDEVDFVQDILARFNKCQECLPRNDSTFHAIVRGFMATGLSSHLPEILSHRLTYGVFPNHYTLNLLLDHFIDQGDFSNAAQVAYVSTMQEDFSNPLNTLLSLHACTKHLFNSNLEDLAPPPKEASDGEEDWIKVKYITYPYYDDHFDVKDERFILGKTLILLSQADSVEIPETVRMGLRLIGSGIYQKFAKGLSVLEKAVESGTALPQSALDYFSQSLEAVEARDPEEPEVEIALRTQDDEIRRLLPTTEEKEQFVSKFAELKDKLVSGNLVSADFDLPSIVEELVKSNTAQFEAGEISAQEKLFSVWAEERQKELNQQVEEFRQIQRIEEMKQQVKQLQAQEELLTYFDNEEKIRLKFLDEDLAATDEKLTISK